MTEKKKNLLQPLRQKNNTPLFARRYVIVLISLTKLFALTFFHDRNEMI